MTIDPFAESQVDFRDFFTRQRPEPEFLAEPLLPKGRSVALVARAKTGKSLLALEIAAAVATGRTCLSGAPLAPRRVMYLDAEMTEDDLLERLTDMGYGPADHDVLFENLHYYLGASLPPLDTKRGGEAVLERVRTVKPDLMVLDTVSRFVEGDENSNDTWQNLYLHTLQLIKREGVTSLRLDHLGKDADKGPRGGSAKTDDVDVEWRMTTEGQRVTLKTHGFARVSWVPEKVVLERVDEPFLKHRWVQDKIILTSAEKDAVRVLDELGVDRFLSRRVLKELIGEWFRDGVIEPAVASRLSMSNESLQRIVNHRKQDRSGQDHPQDHHSPDTQDHRQDHKGETPEPRARTTPGTTQDHSEQGMGTTGPPYRGTRPTPNPDRCQICGYWLNKHKRCNNDDCDAWETPQDRVALFIDEGGLEPVDPVLEEAARTVMDLLDATVVADNTHR